MDHSWVIFIDFEVITGYDTLKDIRVSADFNDATGRPLQTVILVVLDPYNSPKFNFPTLKAGDTTYNALLDIASILKRKQPLPQSMIPIQKNNSNTSINQ